MGAQVNESWIFGHAANLSQCCMLRQSRPRDCLNFVSLPTDRRTHPLIYLAKRQYRRLALFPRLARLTFYAASDDRHLGGDRTAADQTEWTLRFA